MAPSDDDLGFIRDLLAPWGPIRIRRMFGAAGVYADELFIAIVTGDSLYLKADAENRGAFEARGLAPFSYTRKDGRPTTMSFYPPPAEAMEDPELLQPWVEGAIAAARRGAR